MKNYLCIFILTISIFSRLYFFENDSGKTVREEKDFSVSCSEKEGFDAELLKGVFNKIESGDYGSVTSLVLVANDQLIEEQYFDKCSKDSLYTVQSVTKSITSLLVGKALELNYIESIEQQVCSFFPEKICQNSTSKIDSLKLKHLLNMSAGFDWTEKYPIRDRRNSFKKLLQSKKNYIEYLFDQSLLHKPGNEFEYNCALSLVLGNILERNTKMTLDKFADLHLFAPMNISNRWEKYKHSRFTDSSGGLHLCPVDMAKIGCLVKNDGMWKGKQLVAKEWIQQSTKPNVYKNTPSENIGYAYYWWLLDPFFGLDTIIYSNGFAGQNIFIIKEFDLVLVTTGDIKVNKAATISLMFDILACNLLFRQKFVKFYETVDNKNYTIDQFKRDELFLIAKNLILFNEEIKAIDLLEKYSDKFKNNFYYEFYIGKAYFQNGAYKLALKHLQKIKESRFKNAWTLKPYISSAIEMIDVIYENENTIEEVGTL